MFVMYDDVNLALIPKGPHAVASYINGQYANHTEALKMFPHARHLGISVTGIIAAQCYDVETGDYTPDHVPALFEEAKKAGVWRPCFYADLSHMPAVREQLAKVAPARGDYRLWAAYYNGQSDLPAEYDAHQFTDRALGRSLDESICHDNFFPPLKVAEDRVWEARVGVNLDDGNWTISPLPAQTQTEATK